jgi:hypothetical protein
MADGFDRCAERKWLVVVRHYRPLNLEPLLLVSCELSLDPAAQPRSLWPPATCYMADSSRWCAERKWFVVVAVQAVEP